MTDEEIDPKVIWLPFLPHDLRFGMGTSLSNEE